MNTEFRPPFQLAGLPALSRYATVRDEPVRKDAARLDALWPQGKVVLLDRTGRTPVSDDARALRLRDASAIADTRPPEAALLGEQDGVAYWSLPADETLRPDPILPPNAWGLWHGALSESGELWHDLRGVGALLDDTDAGLLTAAVALANWHARARFCAKCAAPVTRTAAGWATTCTGCGREEYPRTDPAVICLIHDTEDEYVLLARQPIWPADRYSVLAGFVEAGESLEACVEREMAEEVGAKVTNIRYLGSQPWPFPRSIMIAFAAQADRDADVKLAEGEIEDARWFTRAEVQKSFTGDSADLILPGATSIAHHMLLAWSQS
ncbi:NADH pyrophosphatase [Alloactinosynnema sp. L-07]|uniref:NAD(+) diphosphatase n=1 Tax=Alloactinosynnema sp. L-07 TaxID=1653480 RepID=UPI00065F0160|nr:NAD(+) diphosphatase [Alloactinosynnema sp. L-07]CRK61806.1 NADH pyrophosphatase [Alloactinosynnema sp. L-07]